jgi:hypothetical protein
MRRTDVMRTLAAAALLTLSLLVAPPANAQQGVTLQGIVDGEFWATSANSLLLSRNGGRPAALGRVQMWGAYAPTTSLVVYAQGEMQGGAASAESEVYTSQFGVRWTASRAFTVDAGRLTPIIGTFSARHFSNRNPLIGEPDGYSTDYPSGVKVSGELARLDYRAGLLSLPTTHSGYEPKPSARARPAIGAGFTPVVGFRIGGSYTQGSYLNRDTPATALDGQSWWSFNQRLAAADVEFARGYLETHFELARGSYDVPGRVRPIVGVTYYGEAKYTFTPRFFAAFRAERNDYPFIRSAANGAWTARLTDFVDGEAGVGYRLTASTLVKASYRADRWWASGFRGPGGHALAMQVSQSFDVMDMLDRARGR